MPLEWSRVQHHARRIKRLGLPRGSHIPGVNHTNAETYQILALHRPTILILPHLQYLGCSDSEMQDHINMFLSPKIIEVSVKWDPSMGPGEHVANLLHSIRAHSPNIWRLRINLDEWDEAESCCPDILDSSFQLPRLRLFDGEPLYLKENSLIQLAALASLTHLKTRISFDPTTDLSKYKGPPFPILTVLDICMQDAEHFNSLMRVISSSRLSTIDLSLDVLPKADVIHQAFRTLGAHPSKTSITSISVQTSQEEEIILSAASYSFIPAIIHPLLSLTNLVNVKLRLPCLYKLTDGVLNEMATSWPRLVSLDVAPSIWADDNQSAVATLDGLIPFSEHCPCLKSLRLIVDGQKGHPNLKSKYTSSSKLESLHLEYSPIDGINDALIAAFLSASFPVLKFITASGEKTACWSRVAELVRLFNKVRFYERQLAVDAMRQDHSSLVAYVDCEWLSEE